MQATYRVHSCSREQVTVQAEYQGVSIAAETPGLVVELLEEGTANTITRRWVPTDIEAEAQVFAEGALVTVSFDPAA